MFNYVCLCLSYLNCLLKLTVLEYKMHIQLKLLYIQQSTLNMLWYMCHFICWLTFATVHAQVPMTRAMYNSISNLMGEEVYPEDWWQERVECLDNLDPKMNAILDKAWEGMLSFWELGEQEEDTWYGCETTKWFESNCTSQPGLGLAIWEPCNYASNLAYDR